LRLETPSAEDLSVESAYPLTDQAADTPASVTHRLVRGASVYIVWLVAGKGLTFVWQVVLGRWLGPASYGLYSLGYGLTSIVSWVCVLGLDQGVLRYCAIHRAREQKAKVRSTLWRALELAGIASALTTALLVFGSRAIAARFFLPSFGSVLVGFALSLPFVSFIRIAATYLQSLHDIYRMSVLQLLARPAVNIVFIVLAIGLSWGLQGAVWAYLLCCVGTAVLAAFYLVQKWPGKFVDRTTMTAPMTVPMTVDDPPLMRYSLALMFAGLSYQVILRAPQLLLGHLSSSAEVGVFSAGSSFALGFSFMSSTFLQPAMPMIVELYEKSQNDGLRRLYQNSTRWTLAAVTPIFLLLSLFNGEVMRLFGRNFSAAGPVLVAMSLGWLAYYGSGPGSALLQMTGRQNLDLANTFGAAVLTVVASYFAIPRYGAMGAALAGAGSISVWAIAEYLEVRVLYGLSPWSWGARRNILVALVTAAVTVFVRAFLPWEILLPTASCIYGVLYFRLCLEPDDRRVVAAALTRLGSVVQRSSPC
jgi:O-antigen/teichoic acid export membrane protein